MKIYAQDSHIVFECPYCGTKETVPPKKTKRAFMMKLMPFYRKHDWECGAKAARETKIKTSADTTTDILDQLREKCH